MVAATTPVMRQFAEAKQEHPDALLFFRMGDFYELFHEDAREAARLLDITLTARRDGIPMAGVPVRAVDTYLRRLVSLGRRVAICEQLEDPKLAKGIVARGVVRVVTPGTLTEESDLEGARNNYLLALVPGRKAIGLAWVDLSTGTFEVCEVTEAALPDEIARIEPAEVLAARTLIDCRPSLQKALEQTLRAPLQDLPAWQFQEDEGRRKLTDHYGVADLGGFGLDGLAPAIGAAGAVVAYLEETQRTALPHLKAPRLHRPDAHLVLDRVTLRCLEVVGNQQDGGRSGTILSVVDRTRTAMGARLLRRWLIAPLRTPSAIHARQAAVAELIERSTAREAVREALETVLDLERLAARVATRRASPRDLLGLGRSLGAVPAVRATLDGARAPELVRACSEADPIQDLREAIDRTIRDDAPLTVREGGIVKTGVSADLDETRGLAKDAKQFLADLQAREVERTGIDTLRVGYNSVFGYYLEAPRSKAHLVPDDYHRRQTLKNVERYMTPELKEYEAKVLSADDRARTLEEEIFLEIREAAAAAIPRLQRTADALACLDALASFAEIAADRAWVCPELTEDGVLSIDQGRHPVLELGTADEPFVANDTALDAEGARTALITGPNMAGKSTYIRQVAVLSLLAHTGSFVPAAAARIGLVDRIFARVGASDDLSRGRSTFMVEMMETANILHHATGRSLVILDEVGRGTSTYDGVALAWAITEHLALVTGCRTLFATHYHELTALPETAPELGLRVVNLRVAVREWGDRVVFLHRIEPGGTDRSYGIHVARLAGLPAAVVERATGVLTGLEDTPSPAPAPGPPHRTQDNSPQQLTLFQEAEHPVLSVLRRVDLPNTTPIEALVLLDQLHRELAGGHEKPSDSEPEGA